MKKTGIFIIFLSTIISFFSCKNRIDKAIFNGIDSQILNIVDSIKNINNNYPFITIWFYSENDSNYISLVGSVPISMNKSPINEWSLFKGYKKYNSVYLVFVQNNENGVFDRFVNKDSLNFDNKPFELMQTKESTKIIDPMKVIYLINKDDSLVFFKREYI